MTEHLVNLNGVVWYALRLCSISESVLGEQHAEKISVEDITDLVGAKLRECPSALLPDLRDLDCSFADLRGVNLAGYDLSNTDLTGADLRGAWFRGHQRLRNLRGADLRGCDLQRADLTGADLRFADLRFADLRKASLDGASLAGARLPFDALDNITLDRDHARGCVLHSY